MPCLFLAQLLLLLLLPHGCAGPQMQLEDFNRYSLVLDIDGNGWSDRYRLISHFRTPVLKQASNLTAFFEHLAAPGIVVEHYAHDLSDLPGRTAALLQQLQKEPGWAVKMAGKVCLLRFAMYHHFAGGKQNKSMLSGGPSCDIQLLPRHCTYMLHVSLLTDQDS